MIVLSIKPLFDVPSDTPGYFEEEPECCTCGRCYECVPREGRF